MNMMAWNGLPKCTELGINMKQTHKIAYDYAQAMRTQRTYERGVEVALNSYAGITKSFHWPSHWSRHTLTWYKNCFHQNYLNG